MARRARGSIFRRKVDGKLESNYSIQWTDERGARRAKRVSPDKSVAESVLAQTLRDVVRRKAGIADPILDHHRQPLTHHADAFLRSIEASHRSSRYVKTLRFRLARLLQVMQATTLADYRLDRAQGALARFLADGISVSTRDHYAALARQFGKWLCDAERVNANPMRTLTRVCRAADLKCNRVALDPASVQVLLDATVEKPVAAYREGHPNAPQQALDTLRFEGECRAVIYSLAATNGLRKNEIKGLRWSDLRLDANPNVALRAETTKDGKGAVLPLTGPTSTRLRQHLSRIHARTGRIPKPDDLVVRVPDKIAMRVREDAARAGIDVPQGRKLDLHALRTTYATTLARAGVPVQVASRLLRHSDIRITINAYTKLDDRDLASSQERLARLLAGDPTATATASGSPLLAQAGARRPESVLAAASGNHE